MKNDTPIKPDRTPADHPFFVLAVRILKAAGTREVYVFGSAANGDINQANDIDFAITGLPPERFFKTMGEVQMAIPKQIDIVDLDEDSPFTRYLREEDELVRIG